MEKSLECVNAKSFIVGKGIRSGVSMCVLVCVCLSLKKKYNRIKCYYTNIFFRSCLIRVFLVHKPNRRTHSIPNITKCEINMASLFLLIQIHTYLTNHMRILHIFSSKTPELCSIIDKIFYSCWLFNISTMYSWWIIGLIAEKKKKRHNRIVTLKAFSYIPDFSFSWMWLNTFIDSVCTINKDETHSTMLVCLNRVLLLEHSLWLRYCLIIGIKCNFLNFIKKIRFALWIFTEEII